MVSFKKHKIITTLITSLLIVLLSQCSKDKFWKDDELSFQKNPYIGNQLRIDGYYYEIGTDGYLYPFCFFYRNGVIIYIGGRYSIAEIDASLRTRISNMDYIDYAKNNKLSGGLFLVDAQAIKFEKWYPSSGGGLPAYVRAGQIINDTTFVITESYRMQKGKKTEVEQMNETYHFRQFSPKPDSTNAFIP